MKTQPEPRPALLDEALGFGGPIIVFDIHEPGAFTAVMKGEGKFTTVVEQPH